MHCKIDGCDRPVAIKSRRLCSACYQRAWKAGTLPPLPPKRSHPHFCDRHEPSRTCYVQCKCRCQGCRDQNSAQARQRAKHRAYGTLSPWVDAEPVREHVRSLMAPEVGSSEGMGWKRIAHAADVGETVVCNLLYDRRGNGPSKRIRRDNADKLLKVRRHLADGATVDAKPARKMLAEMVQGGFCKAELGRYLTGDPGTKVLQVAETKTVTVRNARRIQQLYRAWKAGEIVPRGRQSRYLHGPPSPFPATPGPPQCEDCGQPPLSDGRWCLPCFKAHSRRTA